LTDDRPYLQNHRQDDDVIDPYYLESFGRWPQLAGLSPEDRADIQKAAEECQKTAQLGVALHQNDFDRLAVADAGRELLKMRPSSRYLRMLTQTSDEFEKSQRTIQADPRASASATEELARVAFVRGQDEEALKLCEAGGQRPFSLGLKILILVRQRRSAEALQAWESLSQAGGKEREYVEKVLQETGLRTQKAP
jgi:hypothetical protein